MADLHRRSRLLFEQVLRLPDSLEPLAVAVVGNHHSSGLRGARPDEITLGVDPNHQVRFNATDGMVVEKLVRLLNRDSLQLLEEIQQLCTDAETGVDLKAFFLACVAIITLQETAC